MNNINEKVRYIKVVRKLTYREMAVKTDIPVTTICNIINGVTKKISFETCDKIATGCNVPLTYFRECVPIDYIKPCG